MNTVQGKVKVAKALHKANSLSNSVKKQVTENLNPKPRTTSKEEIKEASPKREKKKNRSSFNNESSASVSTEAAAPQ